MTDQTPDPAKDAAAKDAPAKDAAAKDEAATAAPEEAPRAQSAMQALMAKSTSEGSRGSAGTMVAYEAFSEAAKSPTMKALTLGAKGLIVLTAVGLPVYAVLWKLGVF